MVATYVSIAFAVSAGALQLIGYWWYNTRSGRSINAGSWSMWALGGLIDLISYFALTRDWVLSILPAACAFAAIGTFAYALVKRRFSPLERLDYAFLTLDAGISVTWYFTNAIVANLLFQFSTILSFIPIMRGIMRRTDSEYPAAWLIWSLAYAFLAVSVALRHGQWEDFAYPVSHVLTHLAVAILAFKTKAPRA